MWRRREQAHGDGSCTRAADLLGMSVAPNTSRLVLRLSSFGALSAEDLHALEAAAGATRLHRTHENLTREGESATHVSLLVSGFAYGCRMLPDGRRQIVSYLIPGDLCDPRSKAGKR